ncbi:MAG: di-trans,poly-cis-decaprenylcistransferase [Candidatus Thermoplasmatota archaeon]|nr:di-trans,poly-cis-decaprenylcistransferase [Euryarchaeota archaeon]MBU4033081.1 di-trans,poly-cis-decaprenylcistransferase [Candidatus Thermoplasmatota archaeon]MBU4070704.1 di-trans,poly-cis-decaprenylcistransferase [Candidatus Thermoplasmatota archaeon]MBU4143365.1 di-trans,poly-cis-decaprenylcistransferase [Candidatus Thermoplasmatota archaeon]MBU4591191.1 di-trans,poly-cis-decaprenylcistransferase [Candidatus Thermoplasmatota archaeon]
MPTDSQGYHKSGIISDTAYKQYEKRLLKEVQQFPPPGHVAIIMDGNRRFAKEIGLGPTEGHKKGRNKLEEILEWGMEVGVKVLTVYAFSSENLSRNEGEIKELMKLFEESFYNVADDERVHRNKIRIRALGMIDSLPESVRKAIAHAEERTKNYDNYNLNLAIAYSGREEIIQAIREIAGKVKSGEMTVDQIDQKMFSGYLYTKEFPDPDLILRTSGEVRVSNFLLWQLAYSELYFVDVYWPGFRKIDFLRAIRSYQQRSRRFGK